jgi:cytochrome P450
VSHIPYLIKYLIAITGPGGSFQRVFAFGRGSVLRRLEAGANRKDLFYYLVCQHVGSSRLAPHWNRLQSGEDLPELEDERPSFDDIAQNGTLAIIAGSDTTSSVLTSIIYYLLLNPVAYEHLQEEVDSAFPSGEEPLDVVKLSQLEWLNGCM